MSAIATLSQRFTPRGRLIAGIVGALVLLAAFAGAISLQAAGSNGSDPIYVAVAAPLTGPQTGPGRAIIQAVELYLDAVNQSGGINGRPVKPLLFDDAGSAQTAQAVAPDIAQSQALAVIGHLVSATSMAAGATYRDAHLPAITASGTADDITAGNPYYFRNIFNTSSQGRTLGMYVRQILNEGNVSVIYSDEEYGNAMRTSFTPSFLGQGGDVPATWKYEPGADKQAAWLDDVAAQLRAARPTGTLLLAVSPNTAARDVVVGLRRRGVTMRILGGSSLGSDQFIDLFGEYEEERRQPGYFTSGMYAVAPLIFDSAGERAQVFVEEFRKTYGSAPDLRAAKYYEAAQLLVEALKAASLDGTLSRDANRERVRDALAAFDSPARSMKGLNGPVYFNNANTSPDVVRIGKYEGRQFISAPVQLAAVTNPALVDIPKELAAGHLMRLSDQYVWRQYVVYTGLDFNQVTRLDPGRRSFTTDFFLWFRYSPEAEIDVSGVELPDAIDRNLTIGEPLTDKLVGDLRYRLYRVRGEFRSEFDFRDYPFDRQQLGLRIQHPRYTRDQLIYVVDTLGLEQSIKADKNALAFTGLDSWALRNVRYFQDTLRSESSRGDPAAFSTGRETEFSAVNAVAMVQRRTTVFLLKSLLPLGLLVAVLYVTLYFPSSLLKERLSIAISGLLAAAVLLNAINNQLVDAGYTTAIEYGFYVFFGLCLACTIIALVVARLAGASHHQTARRFELSVRIGYPVVVAATVATYVVKFGSRFF